MPSPRDLTLVDFVGLLSEEPWGTMVTPPPVGVAFKATFRALPPEERRPPVRVAQLILSAPCPHFDPAYLIYLKQQFPSIQPRQDWLYAHWIGENDYALMRTLFGGQSS